MILGHLALAMVAVFGQYGRPLPSITCVLKSYDDSTREAIYELGILDTGITYVVPGARADKAWPVRHFWVSSDPGSGPGYFATRQESRPWNAVATKPFHTNDMVGFSGPEQKKRLRVRLPDDSLHRGATASPKRLRDLQLVIVSNPFSPENFLDSTQLKDWPNLDYSLWMAINQWKRFGTVCTGLRRALPRHESEALRLHCADSVCRDSLSRAFRAATKRYTNRQSLDYVRMFLEVYSRDFPEFDSTDSRWAASREPRRPMVFQRKFLQAIDENRLP